MAGRSPLLEKLRSDCDELGSEVAMLRLTRKKLGQEVDLIDLELRDVRAALDGLVEYERQRHPPTMGGDQYPPSLRALMVAATNALATE